MDTCIKGEHVRCRSEDELFDLGGRIASQLTQETTVLLHGTYGAGKTLLVRGMSLVFGIDPSLISSPSFAVMHEYEGNIPMKHLDLYRIKSLEEWFHLGVEEDLGRSLIVIEWPELITERVPLPKVDIYITIAENQDRCVDIKWYQ
ncbi:tRNA (adenosine(37)-N6)-threonylcarbamoyltransferase complex ATPase subunit type 1 TsaE [Entomospira entomophila]|uniref:tRNA threonylcarbamoyladenosine biosynthesis protein TsaE n=1 Tax=Entomospira entomophila TaxID=2719988 RepID=A0A968G8D1_9SPIO|nr:tRNA (adenosine(37)-N6)-threonylcarbamoyltransferase complex ATPase subunit type 1 TsaE [Entomospira entomophilus]NIZ40452.1 tRNA (adenosine(37)-N6)-threonylcarbamoyltransferase complex ATPase subunit type 1 TsaE [Entomospira entomophilus]WDI36010.1 tRNA (adenosine(37)-N6)-threonylcarbamoyltransferase complex ATPase subunit type 1 TsaE [Entomospira entomophilus]